MKVYKIFVKENEIEVVKQGWSWPAFLFGPIWVLVKKMWLLSAALWSAEIVVGMSSFDVCQLCGLSEEGLIEYFAGTVLFTALSAWVPLRMAFLGYYGNRMLDKIFLSRGYELKDIVQSTSSKKAWVLNWEKDRTKE